MIVPENKIILDTILFYFNFAMIWRLKREAPPPAREA
jgi:hypothetical protein